MCHGLWYNIQARFFWPTHIIKRKGDCTIAYVSPTLEDVKKYRKKMQQLQATNTMLRLPSISYAEEMENAAREFDEDYEEIFYQMVVKIGG